MGDNPSETDLVDFITGSNIGVLLVQPRSLLATAIASVLQKESDMALLGVAHTLLDAAALLRREKIDVVLVDFTISEMTLPSGLASVRESAPEAAMVLLNADGTETGLLDAIDAGAAAYLTTSDTTADHLLEAIRRAARGEVLIPRELFAKAIARRHRVDKVAQEHERELSDFTPRELEVMRLLATGQTTGEIGEQLGIAPHTVEWHVRHLIEKLHVHSKLQAVLEGVRRGLIEISTND